MSRNSTPDMGALFEQFAAFVQAQNATGVEVEAKPTRKVTRKPSTAKRTTTTPAKKRTSAKPRTCNVTAGEAWNALGADPEFEPKDHSKPASGPMLWRLNERGELAQFFA